MERFVYAIPSQRRLRELEDWYCNRASGDWSLRLALTSPQAVSALPRVHPLAFTDMLGLAWRGMLWGGVIALLVLTVSYPYSRGLSESLQSVWQTALPLSLLFFGLWLGGLLGMMRKNPFYQAYSEAGCSAFGLLYVDCNVAQRRLLHREMARLGLAYIDRRQRYCWSYRYPQNRFGGRRPV